MSLPKDHNYADTILAAARKPENITVGPNNHPLILLPDGWTQQDLEKHLPAPLRKRAKVTLTTSDSYIEYLKRHGSLASCVVYVQADYAAGIVGMLAILNDHTETEPAWRDHTANFKPPFSEEWKVWNAKDGEKMSQVEFAEFIEANQKDIAGPREDIKDGEFQPPSGAAMLEMALNLEAKQEVTFKSAIRLQSGTTDLTYRDSEDEETIKKMQVFDRFDIGIPVLFGGASYRINAALRYRINSGRMMFWFELHRPDVVLESAVKDEIEKVRKAGFPVLFGSPGI